MSCPNSDRRSSSIWYAAVHFDVPGLRRCTADRCCAALCAVCCAVQLHAFQDPTHLFLIMPFMQGGDLRYYLNTKGGMSEADCAFYAAEIILGLEELHHLNVVYRSVAALLLLCTCNSLRQRCNQPCILCDVQ
jgi:hypothetical protein